LGILAGGLFTSPLAAQDALASLPSVPAGFSNSSDIATPVSGESLLRGLSISARLASIYDTNVRRNSGSAAEPKESDFLISPGVKLAYERGNADYLLGGSLDLGYDHYFSDRELSGENYSFRLYGGYNGSKSVTALTSKWSHQNGVNRYTGTILDQTSLSGSLAFRYNRSARTSFLGRFDQRINLNRGSGFQDTSSTDANVSALWNASPLVSVGAGVAYGLRTGDTNDDLQTIGPTLSLSYDLSKKIKLRSSFGVNFTDSSDIDGSLVNWSLSLDYTPSIWWGLNLALLRDTRGNFSNLGGFDEVTTYRIGVKKKVSIASLSSGFGYETRKVIGATGTGAGLDDFDNVAIDFAATLPVFENSAELTFSVKYEDFSSEVADQSYDGVQTGLTVSYQF
jgi:hypothetical protein